MESREKEDSRKNKKSARTGIQKFLQAVRPAPVGHNDPPQRDGSRSTKLQLCRLSSAVQILGVLVSARTKDAAVVRLVPFIHFSTECRFTMNFRAATVLLVLASADAFAPQG